MSQQKVSECQSITVSHRATATQTRMPEQQRNELEKLKRLHLQGVELGRGRGISNLDKKARITRPAPLI